MPKKLQKVIVAGVTYNKCPICGGPCARYAWETFRHCTECETLIAQKLPMDQVRAYRMQDMNVEVTDKDLQTIDQLKRKKESEFDFLKRSPAGVNVVAKNKKEAGILKETYERYAYNTDNIPEFNVLINNILTGVLESYRISDRLSIIDVSDDKERRSLLEIHNKVSLRIDQATKTLDDIKLNRLSQSTSILNQEFGKMLKYLKKHNDEYHGVGVCDECGQRIHFYTNFPTFRTRYTETLMKHVEDMTKMGYDTNTIKELTLRIRKELSDDSLADTYAIRFKKELESALM